MHSVMDKNPEISIVIPVYNEEAIIDLLYDRVMTAISSFTQDFEIICVNDGSADQTLPLLVACHEKDPRFKVIDLSRNFGHQAAVLSGLTHSSGNYIGVMDGDLQDPPEEFSRFYHKLKEGYDVVYAVRKKRKENILKRGAYWIYYRFLNSIIDFNFPLDSGDFSMVNRKVLNKMLEIPEQSLYLRGTRSWVGYKQIGMEYERSERQAGEAKYDFRMLLKLANNGIFSFSNMPIEFMRKIGYFSLLVSGLLILRLFYNYFRYQSAPEGFATLLIAIVFFGGVQLVSLGILGEYLFRTYNESRDRPLFIVREKHF